MHKFFRLAILALLLSPLALTACQPLNASQGTNVANTSFNPGFWRPISQRTIDLPNDRAQWKLEYDLRQCNCGNFPGTVPLPVLMEFTADQGRLSETSNAAAAVDVGAPKPMCQTVPALVAQECMRARGWEPTLCAGRLPPVGGGFACNLEQ